MLKISKLINKYTLQWCSNPYHSDSQIVVPRPAPLTLPGTLLEMQILNPTPDLLNQKLSVEPTVYFNEPSGDSDVCWSLRTNALYMYLIQFSQFKGTTYYKN